MIMVYQSADPDLEVKALRDISTFGLSWQMAKRMENT